jgi:hypothetical protein
MEAYQGKGYYVYGKKNERGRGNVRKKNFSSYVWRGVHGQGCARIKHGRKLCVTSTCNKASRFWVQLVVCHKSVVGFVSNLNLS